MKQVPRIVFCPRVAFKKGTTWENMLLSGSYESAVVTPRISFKGMNQDDYNDPAHFPHRWNNVDTLFNGRCREFAAESTLPTGIYLAFTVSSPDEDEASKAAAAVDIFLLRPEQELFMLWQSWGLNTVTSLPQVSSNTVLGLYARTYDFLSGKNAGISCNKAGSKSKDFGSGEYESCLKGTMAKRLQGFSCLPPALAAHLNFTKPVGEEGNHEVQRKKVLFCSVGLQGHQSDRNCASSP